MSFLPLLSTLSEQQCPYTILRDTDELEDVSELDLYVPHEHKQTFLDCLSKHNWLARQLPASDPEHSFFLHFKSNKVKLLDVKFHLTFGTRNRYALTQPITFTAHPSHPSIQIPDTVSQAYLYAAHLTLEKTTFKEKHIKQLKQLIARTKEEVQITVLLETLHQEKTSSPKSLSLMEPFLEKVSPISLIPRQKKRSFHVHVSPSDLGEKLPHIPLKLSLLHYASDSKLKNTLTFLSHVIRDLVRPRQVIQIHASPTSLNIPLIAPVRKPAAQPLETFICSNKNLIQFLGKSV